MVVAQHDTDAYHEIELLPSFVVGGAVGYVRLRSRQSACVHVAGAIDTLSGMEEGRTLGQLEVPVLVSHPAEEHIGVFEPLL